MWRINTETFEESRRISRINLPRTEDSMDLNRFGKPNSLELAPQEKLIIKRNSKTTLEESHTKLERDSIFGRLKRRVRYFIRRETSRTTQHPSLQYDEEKKTWSGDVTGLLPHHQNFVKLSVFFPYF